MAILDKPVAVTPSKAAVNPKGGTHRPKDRVIKPGMRAALLVSQEAMPVVARGKDVRAGGFLAVAWVGATGRPLRLRVVAVLQTVRKRPARVHRRPRPSGSSLPVCKTPWVRVTARPKRRA